jgi:hypothetical protein
MPEVVVQHLLKVLIGRSQNLPVGNGRKENFNEVVDLIPFPLKDEELKLDSRSSVRFARGS